MTNLAASAAASLLMSVVLPLWIAAGLADYYCHRATSIETTSGSAESVLHLVQFALVGIPVAGALFLDINAGYFLFAAIFIVIHHAVAAVDLMYANPKRRIAPREQMIHSVLEMMPFTGFLLLGVMFWPQLLALVGMGSEIPIFDPRVRVLPLSLIVPTLAGAFLLNLVPYLEELWRCLRRSRI